MKKKYPVVLLVALLLSIACVLFYPRGGALKFEPDKLPAAKVGLPYEAKIHVTENRMPAGLELTKVEDEADTH